MADLLRVSQFGGQALDAAQHPGAQGADAGLQREGVRQPVRGYPDVLWLVSGKRTGLVQLAGGGVAFVCTRHSVASRIVADPLDLIAVCGVCEAEREADQGGARRRFLEVLSHG